MDFDDAKENIQPLAAGRNASILHASLHVESIQELQAQRHELEKVIHTYEGEDPLEAWFEYISWIEQSYPSGGKESGLEEVLTKCLTTFESDERYFQDRRMVKLYIKFIEMQNNNNATEFYQQLYNEGIGTMVADFFICWAYCYDLSGNFRKAEEIFRRGIACRAEPLEELQEAHQHFGFTLSQRMLYKDDEDATEYANKQLHERRLALSSLRSHRKKVGSVRTGGAVKSYAPGKLQTTSDLSSSKVRQNARVRVLDENENPQSLAQAAILPAVSAADDETSKRKSVVRSIIDQARDQENKKEPGPWNKAHDKKKGNVFRKSSATTDLGFEIMEDESIRPKKSKISPLFPDISSEIKHFKAFPNFKATNRPLPEWSTPVTIEDGAQARVYPQYHKSKLYPRFNLEFQLEELLAYNWFCKRGIKNKFTVEREEVWKSYEIASVRRYPNFASKSRPQRLDSMDTYFEPEKKNELIIDFQEIYNTAEQIEMQFEEIMLRRWENGLRKIRYDANETIIIAAAMEETICIPHDSEPVNRRKSFFPNRKSLARRTSMMPKIPQAVQLMPENSEHEENSQRDTIDKATESTAKSIKLESASSTKSERTEELLSRSMKKCVVYEVDEEYATSVSSKNLIAKATDQKADSTLSVAVEDVPVGPTIYNDNFQFKTPALPTVSNIKVGLPFEIYEESVEEGIVLPTSENCDFFESDETCSTQAFNWNINQQSVSTPNAPQKTIPRIFGTVLRERTDIEPSAGATPPLSILRSNDAADSKVMAGGGNGVAGVLNFSPPCQKQLSTILETSEQGTNTKSTISSPECDAMEAVKSGIVAHTHLETVQEQTLETTSEKEIATEKLASNTVEAKIPPADQLTTSNVAVSPATTRLHRGGGVNFSIFEDCTESVPPFKKVGNFSRLEEHEETVPGCMIQSIKFQEDKTETVSKIMLISKPETKFSEDKIDTFPKLPFVAECVNDKTENMPKMLFEPPSQDDTFKFFTQTPPKLTKSQVISETPVEHSMLSTTDFLGSDMDAIGTAKPANNHNESHGLSYFEKLNASHKNNPISVRPTADSKQLSILEQQTREAKDSDGTKLKDSFMPDFSFIKETQPEQQQKSKEIQPFSQDLSFIKNSQPHNSRTLSFKQKKKLNTMSDKLPVGVVFSTSNQSLMRDSFNLRDFSMVMDSQPTHQQSTSRLHRAEHPAHENILTASYMKDFSNIKEPTPQKVNPVNNISKFSSSKLSLSFKSSECKVKSMPEPSKKPHQFVNRLENVPITTTMSLSNDKTIKSDDFFELNPETAQFGPNISTIKNSTLLPGDRNQRCEHIDEKSLHIKEEVPLDNDSYEGYELLKSPTEQLHRVSIKPKTAAVVPPPLYPPAAHEDNGGGSLEVIEENSIYFKHTPKTPKLERHIWNHSSEDELQNEPIFIHRTPDLNHTQQIIEHIHLEDNVNPFNAELINAFLEQIDFTNFLEDLPTCQLVGKVKQLTKDSIVTVNDVKFKVQKLIGEGSYGAVFCSSQIKTGKKYALKQERPPNYWEYYICLEVHSRLTVEEMMPAFMSVDYSLIGNNAGILISPLSPYGSLINVCNKIKRVTQKNCDEYVVMHITCLLLEIMDHLHAIEIIHADIKADNFLLMDKLSYDHKKPSIQLIDFGVSIDMRLFKKGQTFGYSHKDNSIKCVEMRENRRWTYQLDLFGLAGVIHVLLFGKYMVVERNVNGFWMHTTHVPRYLNKSLWEKIFKSLLNIRDCSAMPNLQNLRVLIKEELAEKEIYVRQKIFQFNRDLDS